VVQLGWDAAAIAFVAGVVSFFSPCVAPLVPGYIGFLAGRQARGAPPGVESGDAAPRAWRATLMPCLLFVAGFSLAFVALGVVAGSFGRLIAAYRPVLETLAGIVMLAMGAFLLGWLPRPLLAALSKERRLRWPRGDRRTARGVAPVALGVVFAAGWTPCIGPVLAALLAYAGASTDRGAGALLLALYALGFALPFIGVGLGWSAGLRALGWLRRHGAAVQAVTGLSLLLVGTLYLTGQATLFASWAQALALPGPR